MVWASKRVNRPIKWTAERSESFLSDAHGHDHVTHSELALDKDGKFLAMRVHTTAAMMNAVHDALAAAGVKYLDMPVSPHRVWRAIRSAKKT